MSGQLARAGRVLLIALLGLGLAGAGPQRKAGPLVLSTPDTFPVPPAPPSQAGRLQVAPMPDIDVTAPSSAPSNGPRLRPDFFPQRAYNGGQGYIPGSTIEGQQEQRQKPIPGFNLKMPLQ